MVIYIAINMVILYYSGYTNNSYLYFYKYKKSMFLIKHKTTDFKSVCSELYVTLTVFLPKLT